MNMFNKDGRVYKLIPLMLVLTLISALFVYYVFAGIATVTLSGPRNESWFSNGSWLANNSMMVGHPSSLGYINASFNCSAVIDIAQSNVVLGNISLYFASARTADLTLNFNSSNRTGAVNNTGMIINISNIAQGEYWWICSATNNSDPTNKTWATVNRTLFVDWTKPLIGNMSALPEGLNASTNDLKLNWTAWDNVATSFYCNVTVDGRINNSGVAGELTLNNTLTTRTIADFLDGRHNWTVTCWDPTNSSTNTNVSDIRFFNVDTLAPYAIALNGSNGSSWALSTASLNWTVQDVGTAVLSCNLTVNSTGTPYQTIVAQTTIAGTMKSYSLGSLSNGLYSWYVSNCSDTLRNFNNTGAQLNPNGAIGLGPYYFRIDTAAPHTINTVNVTDGVNQSTRIRSFNWTAIDNVADAFLCNLTMQAKIYVLNTTSPKYVPSYNASANVTLYLVNGTSQNTIVQNMPDGIYDWNVTCWDWTNATTNKNTTVTKTFTVDTVAPLNVSILIGNNTNFSSSVVTLNWSTAEPVSSMAYCNLTVDGVVNASVVGRLTNSMVTYSVQGLGDGYHTWYMSNCSDAAGNFNSTLRPAYTPAFYVDLTNPTPTLSLSATSVVLRGSIALGCSAIDTKDSNPSASLRVQLPTGDYSSDVDGTFTDTSTIGTYTASCSATDHVGRSASTSSTFTVGSEVSSSGGGGGGSGATATTTASMSATVSATPEAPAVITVSNAKIPVNEVKLEVTEAASNVQVTVKSLASVPSDAVAAEGKVFKYLQITKSNLEDAKLKSAKIGFFVTRAWMSDNGIDSTDIELKRYTTQWVSLPTSVKTSSDADKFFFEAETPGFSVFAIGVKAAAAEEEVPAEEETPAEEVPETPAEEPVVEEPVAKAKSLTWLYAVIAVLVIAGAAAFFFLKKKKK